MMYARHLAMRTAPALLRAAPIVLLAAPFLGLDAPAGWAAAAAWAAAIAGAVLLGAAISTFMATTLFWTVAGEGVVLLTVALVIFGSGMVVPLPLLPDAVGRVVAWLPFAGLVDAPFRLYTGHLPASAAPGVLLHQAAWTAVIVLGGAALTARGVRRIAVAGG
jgi:ABC-2 type transport system permease protein